VPRELGHVGRGIGRVDRLQRLAGAPVELELACRCEVVVDRVPDQLVTEPKPAGRSRRRLDDPLGHRLVEYVEQRVAGKVAETTQRIEPELAADDRGRDEQLPAALGEAGDALPDHRSEPGRHAQLGRRVLDPPLGLEQSHRLHHEQRVALRAFVDPVRQRRRRPDWGRERHVGADLARTQARQPDQRGTWLAQDLRDRRSQRVAWGGVDIPVRTHNQHPGVADRAGDELEQQQRRLVGRVQVVERDKQRPVPGGGVEPRGGSLEQPEARALALDQRRLRSLGQQRRKVGLGCARIQRPQRLDPGPVGGCPAGLPAAADEHAHSAGARAHRQLVSEAALADPGLAGQQHEPPATRQCVLERSEQFGQLPLAADEQVARLLRLRRPAIERRILAEDRLLEAPQLGAGLDAELVDQRAARVAVDVERLRLAAAAIERQHQLATRAFAERVLGHERLELPDELGMTARLQVGVHAVLERGEPQALEAGDLRSREVLVREVCERRPAPHRERLAQPSRRALRGRFARLGNDPLEARPVELVRLDAQQVAGLARDESPLAELFAQARDVDLNAFRRRARRLFRPKLVDQPRHRDDLVRVQEEDRQQRPLLPRPEVQRVPLLDHLQRAEEPEFHRI
jgi:hypothetical protein